MSHQRTLIGRPCSWVTASRNTPNICHPLHEACGITHATFTCITHGQLHLSVTYKPPPWPPTILQSLSPLGQKKFIHSSRFLHNRPVSPRENQLLPQSQCLPSPHPLSSPSNKASYSVSRDKSPAPTPHALLLPPSVSFHSRCGVSHSGPALCSHPCAPPSLHHTGTISL